MPTRLYSTDPDESLTDHFSHCPNTGIGYSTNVTYRHNGQPTHDHVNEDYSFAFKPEEGKDLCLYGVFDGHENGQKLANFAAQKITAEILFDDALNGNPSDEKINEILRQAFQAVEKSYFGSIDDTLAKRAELEMQIHGLNSFDATVQYPEIVNQLEQLNQKVLGGATAVVALFLNNRLYLANCGDARALLCKVDVDNQLHVWQISTQHDASNDKEYERLTSIGLSKKSVTHLGYPYCTRCFGDFRRKGGYKDIETLREATSEPVIADPDIWGGFVLDNTCRFLILMSAGVYSAWEDATASKHANADIAGMVAAEFAIQNSFDAVAQAVVDRIKRVHHDAFVRCDDRSHLCQHMDDMTLLVRNFNQPLPNVGNYTHTFGNNQSDFTRLNDIQIDFDKSLPIGASALHTSGVTLMEGGETVSDASSWSMEPDERVSLPLDEEGKIASYVDFSEYYEFEAKMKENDEQ